MVVELLSHVLSGCPKLEPLTIRLSCQKILQKFVLLLGQKYHPKYSCLSHSNSRWHSAIADANADVNLALADGKVLTVLKNQKFFCRHKKIWIRKAVPPCSFNLNHSLRSGNWCRRDVRCLVSSYFKPFFTCLKIFDQQNWIRDFSFFWIF